MKKAIKSIVAILLAISMVMGATVVVFAADEVYLSDLRLIYAGSIEEARQALANSKLVGYQVLDENLNSGTGKNGVWLAYKTTTNIDDAITDVSTMQMGGGYNEGNYQQMIQHSKNEYLAMGEIYVQAIDYFAEAYMAGNFLAESAYRQLNVYAGVDIYTEDRLGDLFVDGALTANDLATLFMQGNSYVLKNIRSLLAMGVSYNEEGLTYLQRVSMLASGKYSGYLGESVEAITVDEIQVQESEDVDVLATLIANQLPVFRNMFEELSAYEAELNYEDDEFTDLELEYAEYMAIAELMRAVDYLDGQSLYDFIMNYAAGNKDYTVLYPLANALNEGQVALTKVGHFYDVVRYSMSESPEDTINAQLEELESQYADLPFDVYKGVDRDMYNGTFALTSAAYRADAYTDSMSLGEALFGNGAWVTTTAQIAAGVVGAGLFVWAIARTAKGGFGASKEYVQSLSEKAVQAVTKKTNMIMTETIMNEGTLNPGWMNATFDELKSEFVLKTEVITSFENGTVYRKLEILNDVMTENGVLDTDDGQEIVAAYQKLKVKYDEAYKSSMEAATRPSVWGARIFTGALYIAGALSMAYSAVSLYNKINDYYHPTYDVIPEAMVDLIVTADGDRYIKYDVVTEITMKDGAYPAADLNAFSAQRWNALYFTKSYEAGKPLLADFVLSNVNNRPEEGYLAVHRFGEEVCYDLNKYNFSNKSDSIFLSIKQSENQKSAVADVPVIIGSLFGNGIIFLAGGVGIAFGICGTMGLQAILKKKKKGSDSEEATA